LQIVEAVAAADAASGQGSRAALIAIGLMAGLILCSVAAAVVLWAVGGTKDRGNGNAAIAYSSKPRLPARPASVAAPAAAGKPAEPVPAPVPQPAAKAEPPASSPAPVKVEAAAANKDVVTAVLEKLVTSEPERALSPKERKRLENREVRVRERPAPSVARAAVAPVYRRPFQIARSAVARTAVEIGEAPSVAANVPSPPPQVASLPPPQIGPLQEAVQTTAAPSPTTVPAPPSGSPSRSLEPASPSLTGVWGTVRSAKTASPFAPVSVRLILSEKDGWVSGTLTGKYQAPKQARFNAEVAFSFGGTGGGPLKFQFAGTRNSKGIIELIRLPGSMNTLEVVWSMDGRKLVFDDLFYRLK